GRVVGSLVSRGRRVRVRAQGHGPVVVFVHGWQGHMGQFMTMQDAFVQAGYCAVSFDMPAHGETKGVTSNLIEFSEVLAQACQLVGPVHAVVGHSLGGTALSLALKAGLSIEAAVMVAPLMSFDFALDEFAKYFALGQTARERLARSTEARVGFRRAELDLSRIERPHDHLLLLHDRKDKLTFAHDTARLAELWSVPFFETDGLGHGRILKSSEVIERIIRFINAAPRPQALDLGAQLAAVGEFVL
ncbi:MAG TPA: alpha/beta fold hydrolase, partial [Polyangiaceae bacterium]|nr:alpha/beta fold hydrolase [Polyangiaceae bacterium]